GSSHPQPDVGDALALAPVRAPVLPVEARDFPDARPRGERLDLGDVAKDFELHQMSRSPFIEACPDLPMMMWSWTVMPRGFATSMIWRVICTSAVEGAGSPEGWLWTRMSAVALSSRLRLMTSRG